MKKKKLNPRRIPISKALVDKNAILEEATQDDMYRAWLLVVHSILELELLPASEIAALADSVNKCIASTSAYDSVAVPVRVRRAAFSDRAQKSRDSELQRAEGLMGIAVPYDHLNPDHIHSAVQLEAFKKKVCRVAIHTSLCVLCLGLEASKRFSEDELRRIFFNADMTMAEIDNGINSYTELETTLSAQMLQVSVTEKEYSSVNVSLKE